MGKRGFVTGATGRGTEAARRRALPLSLLAALISGFFLVGLLSCNFTSESSGSHGANKSDQLGAGKIALQQTAAGECGNYWQRYELGLGLESLPQEVQDKIRSQAVEVLKGLLQGQPENDFADIHLTTERRTWDELSLQEKRQLLELGLGPLAIGQLIHRAREAGIENPEEIDYQQLYRMLGGTNPVVPKLNVIQCRPVNYFAKSFSPGDVFVRVLTPAEYQDYVTKNNGSGSLQDCQTVAVYWRVYGEKGVILETVGRFASSQQDLECLRQKVGALPSGGPLPDSGGNSTGPGSQPFSSS